MKCYLCGATDIVKRQGSVRDGAGLTVLECSSCGLVFLSSFDHISDEYYVQSGMHQNLRDIKTWINETATDDERRFNLLLRSIENKKLLDVGCGNGGFLLKARNVAYRAEGVELEKRFSEYYCESGLKVYPNIDEVLDTYDIITLFHVLEHIPDPIKMLQELSMHLDEGGELVIEVPSADDALLTLFQSEAFTNFTYWSCHLYLFTNWTLEQVAKKAGLKVNYIKQIQRYPLSNHLHWLARQKPGGHQKWGMLDSPELHSAYEKALAVIGACDTIIGSFSK